jgi:hypothetical protein
LPAALSSILCLRRCVLLFAYGKRKSPVSFA